MKKSTKTLTTKFDNLKFKIQNLKLFFAFLGALGVLVVNSFWLIASAWGAEPRLDTDVLSIYRAAASAGVQDGLFNQEKLTEEKALRLTEDQYGPVHPALVPVLNDLATLEWYCGEYQKAEENYKWGLAIREKTLGTADPAVGESLDNLAGVEMDRGEFSEAEVHFRRALTLQEKSLGKDSLATAGTLTGLGDLYFQMNRPDDALPILKRCLAIHEKVWGSDDPKLTEDLDNLARVFMLKADFDSVESDLNRALAIQQKAFSSDHPSVADSTEKLAAFYMTRGQTDKAKTLYEEAYKNRERFLSNKDFRSMPFLYAAAMDDFVLGQLKESEILLNQILKSRKETYGTGHPRVAFCLEDLAAVYEANHQKAKALTSLREAKIILGKMFDPSHPEILKIEKKLKQLSE